MNLLYIGYTHIDNFGDSVLFDITQNTFSPQHLLPWYRDTRKRTRVYQSIGWSMGLPQPFDGVIQGGGTLLSHTEMTFYLEWYALRKKIICYGAGSKSQSEIDKLNLQIPYFIYRKCFEKFIGIGVRGPLTKHVLENISPSLTVDIIGDPMLDIYPYSIERPSNTDTAVICITKMSTTQKHWHPVKGDDYQEVYKKCIQYCKNKGYKIRLIIASNCEEEWAKELLKKKQVDEYQWVHTLEDATQALQDAVFVISARLHIFILSVILGIPSVPICYQDKYLDFMGSLDWENSLLKNATEIDQTSWEEYFDDSINYTKESKQKIDQKICDLNNRRKTFRETCLAKLSI